MWRSSGRRWTGTTKALRALGPTEVDEELRRLAQKEVEAALARLEAAAAGGRRRGMSGPPYGDASGDTRLHLSALTNIYKRHDGTRRLNRGEITAIEIFSGGFPELADHVLRRLAYPRPTPDKAEAYGWVPACYRPSEQFIITQSGPVLRERFWRDGDFEEPRLCLMYADIDNAAAERPHMTEERVADGLEAIHGGPVRFFTYTTWSSRADHRKFRVVYDTSRWLTRGEQRRCHIALSELVYGGQGDSSIYDPGDFIYGPPHGAEVTRREGGVLDVDLLLALEAELRREQPDEIAARYDPRPRSHAARPARAMTQAEEAALRQRIADASIRSGFLGIDDPAVFNPGWRDEFARTAVQGSHYATMLSLLGRVWRKSGGTLSRGEMLAVYEDIDATGSFYMRSKYGVEKAAEMVDFVMSCPVTGWKPISTTPAGCWRSCAVRGRGRAGSQTPADTEAGRSVFGGIP